jgi:hypothetical protein
MTTTSPKVQFGLYGLTIKSDGTLSSVSDLQPFVDLDDLRTDNVAGRAYASYEPDYWLLDGGYKFIPDTAAHAGMVSLEMSDFVGDFADPPVLTIDFSVPHTTDGLSLRFSQYSGDYATLIYVRWYDAGGNLILEAPYLPDSTEFSVEQNVANFSRLTITFNSTNRPYRYIRLRGIDYGTLITFEGDSIKSLSVVEEADPLSAQVRINSLEMELFSSESAFSILNPTGSYGGLKEHQPLAVYETVDDGQVFMGRYFLEDWENTSDQKIKFTAVDLISLMDKITVYGGLWVSGDIVVQDLIADLLETASIPYEFDATLNDIEIVGWLPVGTLREALQQIAFAVGASVDCSRSWVVKIAATKIAADETPTATIVSAQKGAKSLVKLQPQIAGVEVTAHSYVENTVSRDLYKGDLAAGDYERQFDKPAHDLGITGATITESGPNYALLNVTAPGTVTLTGEGYEDTIQVVKIANPDVTGDIKPVKRVKDATLVNPDNVADVAQRVYDYSVQRYAQTLKLFAPTDIEVGTVALIDTLYGQQLQVLIEKMSIDLAMGMTAHVEAVGVVAV